MEFYAQVSNKKLLPLHDSDSEVLNKLKAKHDYKFVVTSPRNYKFHKKLFALINLGYQNTESGMNFEEFRAYKIMQAGYYNRVVTEKGEFYLPKSISFASMDDLEFEKLYSSMVNVMITTLGCTSEEIEQELINFF
jgi:hypothetical protein